eukprot:m51a1_g11707 hypothetical protein (995) ;mRNA; f:51343-57706
MMDDDSIERLMGTDEASRLASGTDEDVEESGSKTCLAVAPRADEPAGVGRFVRNPVARLTPLRTNMLHVSISRRVDECELYEQGLIREVAAYDAWPSEQQIAANAGAPPATDFCLLKVLSAPLPEGTDVCVTPSAKKLQKGSKIFIIGFPGHPKSGVRIGGIRYTAEQIVSSFGGGESLCIACGEVTTVSEDGSLFTHNASTLPGMSGAEDDEEEAREVVTVQITPDETRLLLEDLRSVRDAADEVVVALDTLGLGSSRAARCARAVSSELTVAARQLSLRHVTMTRDGVAPAPAPGGGGTGELQERELAELRRRLREADDRVAALAEARGTEGRAPLVAAGTAGAGQGSAALAEAEAEVSRLRADIASLRERNESLAAELAQRPRAEEGAEDMERLRGERDALAAAKSALQTVAELRSAALARDREETALKEGFERERAKLLAEIKELRAQREAEASRPSSDSSGMSAKRDALAAAKNALESEIAELTTQHAGDISRMRAECEALAAANRARESEVAELRAQHAGEISRMTVGHDALKTASRISEAEIADLRSAMVTAARDKAAVEQELQASRDEISGLRAQRELEGSDTSKMQQELAALADAKRRLESEVTELRSASLGPARRAAESEAEVAALRTKVGELQAQLEAAASERSSESARALSEHDSLIAAIKALEAQVAELRSSSQSNTNEAEAGRARAEQESATLRQQLAEMQAAREQDTARHSSELSRMEKEREDLAAAKGALEAQLSELRQSPAADAPVAKLQPRSADATTVRPQSRVADSPVSKPEEQAPPTQFRDPATKRDADAPPHVSETSKAVREQAATVHRAKAASVQVHMQAAQPTAPADAHAHARLSSSSLSRLIRPPPKPLDPTSPSPVATPSDTTEQAVVEWLGTWGIEIKMSLWTEVSDCVVILRAIDAMKPGSVNWKSVSRPREGRQLQLFQKLANFSAVVDAGRAIGLALDVVDPKHIAESNQKAILSVFALLMDWKK